MSDTYFIGRAIGWEKSNHVVVNVTSIEKKLVLEALSNTHPPGYMLVDNPKVYVDLLNSIRDPRLEKWLLKTHLNEDQIRNMICYDFLSLRKILISSGTGLNKDTEVYDSLMKTFNTHFYKRRA